MQFKLNLPGGELIFPQKPVTIPADEFFFWPFNLDLGGAKLIYATAQPVCKIDDRRRANFLFRRERRACKAEFVFDPETLAERQERGGPPASSGVAARGGPPALLFKT